MKDQNPEQESTQEQSTQEVTFSDEQQAHIQTILDAEKEKWETQFNTLVTERDELKGKIPVELSEQEKQLQEREAALTKREISVGLTSKGYGDFEDILKVSTPDEIEAVVTKLESILGNRKIDQSYIPSENKGQSEHGQGKGNALDMIAGKLGQAFGR